MRIGSNPNNHTILNNTTTSHRIIIAVYIPNNKGYFQDSLIVFKVCMESLLKTINSDTAISVISNGSSNEVNEYIYELHSNKSINRAIFNSQNIGKVNALIAETHASFEEYITYSDADVFFDKGWLKKTFDIFKSFPKVGFISMNPMPSSYGFASSAIVDNIFSLTKKTKAISDFCKYDDIAHFHKSVGRQEDITRKLFVNKALVLEKGEESCFIGAGHFCCTVKKYPLLKYLPSEKANTSGSEKDYLDIPFEKTGLWRVSSTKAYVWHMGNVLEKQWANSKLSSISDFKEINFSFSAIKNPNFTISSLIPYKLKMKTVAVFKKLKTF